MIVTLAPDAPDSTRSAIAEAAALIGSGARELTWEDGIRVVAVDGDLDANVLRLPGVVASYDKHKNYMLASKLVRERSVVRIGDVEIGGDRPVIMAGPCVVEDRESTIDIAREARANGAVMLRGGAYKPRTSPYAFQGLGEAGARAPGPPARNRAADRHRGDGARCRSIVATMPTCSRSAHATCRITRCFDASAAVPSPGAAQARLLGDDRGVADGCRIHPRTWQPRMSCSASAASARSIRPPASPST